MDFPVNSPLSSCQLDVWAGSSLFPELPQYNIVICDRIAGSVDLAVMRECLERAALRNDALRLRLDAVDGVPCQWATPQAPEVRIVDLSDTDDPAAACVARLRDSFSRPLELSDGSPTEFLLLRESDTVTYVHVKAHHIVTDAWGLNLLMGQVRADYEHVVRTGEPLAQTAPSYLDAVAAEGDYRSSAAYERDRAFFRDGLRDVDPALFTRKAPSGSRRTDRHSFTIGRDLVDRIRDRGESPFVVIAAAVSVYLSRVHRSSDVVLGVPLLNRHGQDAKQTVGHFANTLPLRVAVKSGQPVSELIRTISAGTRKVVRHERISLGEVLRDLPDRGSHGSLLFDTTISYLRWPESDQLPGLSYSTVARTHAHDQDAVAMWIYEFDRDSDLLVDIEYACDVFDADFSIESVGGHLLTLLRNVVDLPDGPVRDVPMLTDQERHDLVVARNDTAVDHDLDTTLPELFSAQVARTPDRIAVTSATGERLTFAELDVRVDSLARLLRADGVGVGDRVAVLVERGIPMMVGILGVLKAGGAYVPVDPGYPAERIRMLVDDCGAKVLLVSQDIPAPVREDVTVRRLDLTSLTTGPALEPVAGPHDLAYVIYTSGSTGRPKGVMVEHRSVVNRLLWMQRSNPIGDGDVLIQKTPTSFDVSVWELFWWALTGARLALPAVGAEKDPRLILRAVADERVSVIHFVPSMLGPWLDLIEDDQEALTQAASLRVVFCSGEALPPARVEQFNRIFGQDSAPKLVNLYGPTEATVDVSYFDCPTEPVSRVPIGRPIDNIALYVLGVDDQPQPQGAAGELCIGGVGVARGYLDRPGLTAEKFIDDPFTKGGRLYRTGDLARWLADGTLEYLGRLDDQVKVRGNRVELGEVRERLAAVAGVRDATVLTLDTPARGVQLVGYYVADAEIEPAELRAELATELPEFMLPAQFVRIDRIPLTAHGKIDRRALPAPRQSVGQAPATETQARLAAIWADVLGLAQVGVHDNFFALGGDSILMLRVRARAEKEGLFFALADLHQNPTVAELAQRLSTGPTSEVDQDVAPFAMVSDVDRPGLVWAEDAYPPSRLSLGMLYHGMQDQDSAVYRDVFRYTLEIAWDESAFRQAFEALVARHPSLRTSFELARYSEPLRIVHREVEGGLAVVDLRQRSADDAEAVVLKHIEERKRHNYQPQHAPLYEFAPHVHESTVDLVLSFHHSILDGWSAATLVVELVRDYLYRLGEPVEPVPVQAAPSAAIHARQEQRVLDSERAKRYWQDLLAGVDPVHLDGFRPHEPKAEHISSVAHRLDFSGELTKALHRAAADHGIPVKSLLFAAHCLTLRLFVGSDEVTTGLVTHARPEVADTERTTGLFLNTVPLRLAGGQHSWLEVARAVADQERESQPYRGYPLSAIQADCGSSLFGTAFNYVHLHVLAPLSQLPGVRLAGFQVWEENNFDLFVNAIHDPVDGRLYLRVDTDGRTVTQDQAALVGQTYLRILDRIVTRPTEPVDFGFLPPAVRQSPGTGPLIDVITLFTNQVACTPDALAVAFNDRQWNYLELDRVSTTIAANLRGHGVTPGSHVGVALNRSPEMIATVLGILKAGAACVPLDVSYPEHRLAAILANAQPVRVVAQPKHAHLVPDPSIVLSVDQITAESADTSPLPVIDIDDIACVLFTSGSTGQPKGVRLPHRMWANYVRWQLSVPSGAPGATTLQFAPLSFDMSFQEIFSTLAGGGALRLVSEDDRLDPPALLRLLETYEVERVLLPFVALQRLAESSHALGVRPPRLRVVVSSGEQLRVTDEVRRFCAAVPGTLLENQYGPTETHQVTYYSMTGDPAGFPDLPPIGTPLDGVEVRVLDADREPVPVGVVGEIYLGGECLALDYNRQPELTDRVFVPHPTQNGARMYRTGDLGRLLPSGEVVWLGRADNQVKVRGFRIEPAEVELAIMRAADQHPGVRAAAVVARRRDDVDSFLAAFLVGDPDTTDLDDLAKQLRGMLPEYMVPSHFAWVERFPLTPSGKRDDAALRLIPLAANVSTDDTPPSDDYERTLVEILTELLHLPSVGVHDNFFAVGGTSLTAMQVVVTIEKRYGVNVPLSAFVATPTVAGLAQRLRSNEAVAEFDPLVPIRPSGTRPPLFLVHPLGGHVLCYLTLTGKLPEDLPVYGLQAAGSDPGTVPLPSVAEIAASYLAAIRRVQPEGPYTLGGWSFGGFVAFEMARQLRASDPDAVAELLVLDSITVRREREHELTDDALLELFFWELVWFEHGEAPIESLPVTSMTLDEKFDFIMRRAVNKGVLARGASAASVRRLFELFKANWRALLDYQPPVDDYDLTLVRAEGALPDALRPMHDAAKSLHLDPLNGWGRWTTGRLDVVDVPGDHLGLVQEPAVDFVARAIMDRLDSHGSKASD